MKFKVDENLPIEVALALREAGGEGGFAPRPVSATDRVGDAGRTGRHRGGSATRWSAREPASVSGRDAEGIDAVD
jgi:hypothetical protein